MLQINSIQEKSLFSQVVEILDKLESPRKMEKITVANQPSSKPLVNIAKKFGNYALSLKQLNLQKTQELPIMAG